MYYFATDGSYGSADSMEVLDTTKWTEADWEEIFEAYDHNRVEVALEIARKYVGKSTVEENLNDQELVGTCDTCGTDYDVSSREGRCGDCGECSQHCTHNENENEEGI